MHGNEKGGDEENGRSDEAILRGAILFDALHDRVVRELAPLHFRIQLLSRCVLDLDWIPRPCHRKFRHLGQH